VKAELLWKQELCCGSRGCVVEAEACVISAHINKGISHSVSVEASTTL
jgi:hypothetical protein